MTNRNGFDDGEFEFFDQDGEFARGADPVPPGLCPD
jgi:hypothetical protein